MSVTAFLRLTTSDERSKPIYVAQHAIVALFPVNKDLDAGPTEVWIAGEPDAITVKESANSITFMMS